jgi:putative membrane protein
MGSGYEDDPRIPLAAERTLLAWLRTALAFMGLGFVIARFGWFLREIAAIHNEEFTAASGGLSLWVGVAFVIVGSVMSVLAAVQHRRFLENLERGERYKPSRWSLGVVIAAVLAISGLGVAAYLVVMPH